MKVPSDWIQQAVCNNDSKPHAWTSSKYDDIVYAKDGCSRCAVRLPCFLRAWQDDFYTGVNAGISEYDLLDLTWKEVKKQDGNNWSRTDKVLQRILRQIK